MPDAAPVSRFAVAAASLAPLIVFLTLYGTLAGRGFVADDFEWALHSRSRSLADIASLVHHNNGFFRPVVAMTFAANEYLARTSPKPYGLTNLFLAVACAFAIARLCRALGLPWGAGILAGALWLFNFHGVNMAVLWISGRTALLLTLGATLSMAALLRGKHLPAALWLAIALFSKEEAILLPVVGLAWLMLLPGDETGKPRPAATWLILSALVVTVYLALRFASGAMTPWDAPSYYRLTVAPATVGRNVLEYADRTLTFSVIATALALGLLGWPAGLGSEQKRLLWACGCWIVGAFAITVFLPVRSSLYACLPSAGVAISAAAIVAASWRTAPNLRRRRAVYAAIVLPFLLAPLHYTRSLRYVGNAQFSRQALSALAVLTQSLPEGSVVVVDDERMNRTNMAASFGALLDVAFLFQEKRQLRFWIEPPVAFAALAGLHRPCRECASAEVAVRSGHLVAVR